MGRPAAAVQLPAALPRLVALAWPRRGHRTALTLLQGLAIGRGLVAFGEALAGHSGAAGELVQICMRRFAPAGRGAGLVFAPGRCARWLRCSCWRSWSGPAACRCACVATWWPRIRARTRCALGAAFMDCSCLLPGGSPHRVSSSHGLDVAQPGQGTRA